MFPSWPAEEIPTAIPVGRLNEDESCDHSGHRVPDGSHENHVHQEQDSARDRSGSAPVPPLREETRHPPHQTRPPPPGAVRRVARLVGAPRRLGHPRLGRCSRPPRRRPPRRRPLRPPHPPQNVPRATDPIPQMIIPHVPDLG